MKPYLKSLRALTGLLLFCLLLASSHVHADDALPTISTKVKDMKAYEGFYDFYWDEKTGKVWLKIDRYDEEFLFLNWLAAGLGSNDIGLDRGQGGENRVVKFSRVGPKVMMVQPNYTYQAISDNPDERASVEQAFAQSVLWGFKVAAAEGDAVLVDLSDFLLHDWHGVSGRLAAMGEGNYKVDGSRSAVYLDMCKAFPENTEFEATLTYKGKPTGAYVGTVAPTAEAITLRLHHSFVKLPDAGYKPRRFDPRGGFWPLNIADYASPIDQALVSKFIYRHRLEKKDPNAAMSEAVEPIVYYVDRGAPEPVRSALIEGASWWNQAFEAAGYKDAFQVKVLPADADPLDVRYNLIQWVHRSTRGWSYGNPITDPRTGEIIKGHVSLGSLRVRQDFLIATGLLSPYEDGTTIPPEMEQMALARLRQLSAHEVGHTLGIAHNFAASAKDRASVMDYPHPMVTIKDGKISLEDAYAVGIGDWDKVTIAFGYQDFPEGTDEAAALNKILNDAVAAGHRFISDADARPRGGAHPYAHLWDNGSDPAEELNRVMEVRALALQNFSEKAIRNGQPYSDLEEVLVPIYLFHRYQTEAAVKMIGGIDYSFAVRGDAQTIVKPVEAAEQRAAIAAVIATITPEALMLSEDILKLLPPKAYGYNRSRESFKARTGVAFDMLGATETAASMSLGLLLNAQRANRMVELKARYDHLPGLIEMLRNLSDATWFEKSLTGVEGEVQRTIRMLVLQHMMRLGASPYAMPQVKAIVNSELIRVKGVIDSRVVLSRDDARRVHAKYASSLIDQYLQTLTLPKPPSPLGTPDGSPIGMSCQFD